MKKIILLFAFIFSFSAKAQFTFGYTPADSIWHNLGGWSYVDLYQQKDSTAYPYSSLWRFTSKLVEFRNLSKEFPNRNHDTLVCVDPNGRTYKRSVSSLPSSTIAIISTNGISTLQSGNTFTISKTKRQETYTAITNSIGIASFTFSAFSSTPNIQYNPGYGFGNKETCIPNAAPTTTSCSFYVQLRADVLGILPSYSNVVGREVNILITEK